MQTLERNLEKKLIEKIKSEDAEMTPVIENRVSSLEQQMESLTATMTQFQHSQANHNQMVQQSISQIDTKVDNQAMTFNTLLDTKMDDQMRRIERLLLKRPAE